ncbi:hypothetical protein COLO4_10086 [Corchorus olitorius]|uniref:ApaG domain-containing protein n=1 Tax=Corchorus olitorius TaxID=93759 RepID=A0A1R3KA30_9ROSI|nr:hypothetical protein COLO4_10086 [Corchorus olitorius]
MGLEGLGDLALHIILSKLGPEDTVRASCVSRRLRLSTSEDSLWAQFCFQDLHLSSPQDHQGNPAPSFKVIVETRAVIRHLGFSSRSKYIVVAASSTSSEKLFFLNCNNGQLYVGTRNLPTDGEMIQCVPNQLIRYVHDLHGDQQQDAMLLWLEEHGRRLEDGIIKVREEEIGRIISLFPEIPPLCSTAVTNGVQVRASAVFVPEYTNLQNEAEKYLFAYSIRMSLLPEGCIINGMTFSSCQLHWRHWIICANEAVISDVHGEAVIGQVGRPERQSI